MLFTENIFKEKTIYSCVTHRFRVSGDFSLVDKEVPLGKKPFFDVFSGVACQDPLLFPLVELLLACSRLFSRFAIFCSISINICCSSSIISETAYELQLPSGGLYRISKHTTAYTYNQQSIRGIDR